jgi:CheY-like chemotaxis protein
LSTPIPSSPTPSLSKTFDRRDLKILLAEDSVVSQKMALRLMRAAGCSSYRVVGDGQLAVDNLLLDDYHVAILDMEMPTLAGLQVIQNIFARKKNRLPHFIICSGHEPDEIRAKLAKEKIATPVEVLKKPLRYDALVATVNRMTKIPA